MGDFKEERQVQARAENAERALQEKNELDFLLRSSSALPAMVGCALSHSSPMRLMAHCRLHSCCNTIMRARPCHQAAARTTQADGEADALEPMLFVLPRSFSTEWRDWVNRRKRSAVTRPEAIDLHVSACFP